MKLFSIEEFSAKRRGAQDRYALQLRLSVKRAIASGDHDKALAAAGRVFTDSYRGDTDKPMNKTAFNRFIKAMEAALKNTTPESDVTATALMIALAAINASAVAAADADDEALELEWVDMDDKAVRASHRAAAGQIRPPGEPFSVGGFDMDYPGYTGAPIGEWINCRCTLRPVAAGTSEAAALRKSLIADSSGDHSADTSLVVVALPAAGDPVHGIGEEQKHVTLAYLGSFGGDAQAVHNAVENLAAANPPDFIGAVNGRGTLGEHPDAATGAAKIWLVESAMIQALHDVLVEDPEIALGLEASADSQHPHFIPHMTVDYADELPAGAESVSEITFDRLAVWQGDQQTEYPLGAPSSVPVDKGPAEAPVEPVDPDEEIAFALALAEAVPMDPEVKPAEAPVPAASPPILADVGPIPVHGVLAPEGIGSGDGRGFREGSLTNRPLPLPLTWQERTAEGHDDAAVVVAIEKIQVIDGLQHWSGHMRQTEDADKALGLLVDFGGRYGLSVDADAAVGEFDEAEDMTWFSEARTCGASMVNIPAFHEAYIALGPHPILDAPDAPLPVAEPDKAVAPEPVDEGESLVAHGAFLERAVQLFKDLAPGITEDGPGWLTNPVDTDRLRDYWVRGEGSARIGWGVPGDFNRCRVNLAEYVKPQYLNGYCANRHYDALGVWPGQEAADQTVIEAASKDEAPSVSLVASGTAWAAPSAWFNNPDLTEPTGVVITDEGQTYGYIATWGECHIGLPGACTSPPTSDVDYGYFKTGMVPTREGGFVEVGQLTIGGGHADPRLGYRGATAHYDNTCSVWADVNVGEDAIGIWFAGSVRPNVNEDMLYAARASGRLSGDWRDVHGNLELSGALSVNVPGFPIPKVAFAMNGGRQTALVASGIVAEPVTGPVIPGVTQNLTPEQFADLVGLVLDRRETIKEIKTALERD